MALSEEQLAGMGALLLAAAPQDNPVPAIRAGFPGLHVSRCDAADMRGETPYRRAGEFELFLVDTASHCWQIVDDPQHASGVVVAPRSA